jgi:GT2 family glycosyltransferase
MHDVSDADQIQFYGDGVWAVTGVDDELDTRTLPLVRRMFDENPGISVIYGDVWEGDELTPKPAWDEVLAQHYDFVGLPLFFRTEPSGEALQNEAERLSKLRAQGNVFERLPLPIAARATTLAPRLKLPSLPRFEVTPKVSIIIPTKIRYDLLRLCLDGLARNTSYPVHEVIVIDNGSTDPKVSEEVRLASAYLNIITERDEGNFNFSRLINRGVKLSTGDLLLLLNDDVRPLEADWLSRMVSSALEHNVGAVGARLQYPSGDIQHAGVIIHGGGICQHLWRDLPPERAALNPYVMLPSRRLAVTAACLLVHRSAFDDVGGFDEDLAVTLNDIDFCLKLHATGRRNIYRGDAVLLHSESQSRGDDDVSVKTRLRRNEEAERFRQRWGGLGADPYGSPLFDVSTDSGAVLAPKISV